MANCVILSCFGHIIQLGIEDLMGEITSKAMVTTKQVIWDYNPEDEDNLINGGVDVIVIVRTLTVKVSLHGYDTHPAFLLVMLHSLLQHLTEPDICMSCRMAVVNTL